jgi:hypothetical protein
LVMTVPEKGSNFLAPVGIESPRVPTFWGASQRREWDIFHKNGGDAG